MTSFSRILILAVGLFSSVFSTAAVVFQTNAAGTLTGVIGVRVGSLAYDVRFGDATCSAYIDCGSNPMSYRIGVSGDLAFSTALLEQVFDGSSVMSDFYTKNPDKINGCEYDFLCEIWSPIRIETNQNRPYLAGETIANWNPLYAQDSVGPGQAVLYYNFSSPAQTFAVWSLGYTPPIETVPEPSTYGLVALALALMAGGSRFAKRFDAGVPMRKA